MDKSFVEQEIKLAAIPDPSPTERNREYLEDLRQIEKRLTENNNIVLVREFQEILAADIYLKSIKRIMRRATQRRRAYLFKAYRKSNRICFCATSNINAVEGFRYAEVYVEIDPSVKPLQRTVEIIDAFVQSVEAKISGDFKGMVYVKCFKNTTEAASYTKKNYVVLANYGITIRQRGIRAYHYEKAVLDSQ